MPTSVYIRRLLYAAAISTTTAVWGQQLCSGEVHLQPEAIRLYSYYSRPECSRADGTVADGTVADGTVLKAVLRPLSGTVITSAHCSRGTVIT